MGKPPIRSTENLMKIGRGVPKIGPMTDRQICRRTHRHTNRQNTQTRLSQYSAPYWGAEKIKTRNVFCVIGSINGGQQAENETMNAKNLWFIDNDCTNGQ